MRKIISQFKQEIYKEDLKKVLSSGIVAMLLYSVLAALVNVVLIFVFKIQTSMFIYLIGYFISNAVRNSYYKGHILYPTLSVLFLIVGLFIYNIVAVFAYNQQFSITYFLLSVESGALKTLNTFNPLYYLNDFSVWEVFSLLIVLYTIFYTFRNSKNNYY